MDTLTKMQNAITSLAEHAKEVNERADKRMLRLEGIVKKTEAQLAEHGRRIDESNRRIDENNRRIDKNNREIKAIHKRMDATNERIDASNREIATLGREMKEMNKQVTKQLNKTLSEFNSKWGKFMESLVDGDLVRLLNQWGIKVNDTLTRRKGSKAGENYELDIIAIDGDTIVVVEVKTTLRVEDVRNHLKRLPKIKSWLTEFSDKKVVGAVAYLQNEEHSAEMAENKGLFVIRATGKSATITNNKEQFKPKHF